MTPPFSYEKAATLHDPREAAALGDNSGPSFVFFDLDGTLIRGLSCEQRFFRVLLGKGLVGWRQMAVFCTVGLQGFRQGRRDIWKKNKTYLAGLSTSTVAALGEAFALTRLRPALHPTVKQRLDAHLQGGDTVVLLTGAPDFIAAPLAAILGIPMTSATVCPHAESRFIAALPRVHPYGEAKRRIADQLCRDHGGSLAESAAYANACSDLPLLNAVGRPVAVFPDRRLRRIAAARGWGIIEPGQ